MNNSEYWMGKAYDQALLAYIKGEVPIGAVIVKDDQLIATGFNLRESAQNSLAHAEIIAISNACQKLNSWRLIDCDLYVTIEPCPMCAGALINSRVRKVFFGALDPKAGAIISLEQVLDNPSFNHQVSFNAGCLAKPSRKLIKDFFKDARKRRKDAKNSL